MVLIMPDHVALLRCSRCQTSFDPGTVRYACPHCGDHAILDVGYDYARIAQRIDRDALARNTDPSLRRWLPLLPLERDTLPPLPVGGTPLHHAQRLGAQLGLHQLYLKDDGRNPTASFKDRASAIVLAKAVELDETTVATASSGNAAAALAGLAASQGTRTVIFVPRTAPEAKIAQLLIYGAEVLVVEGTYDQAFDLCLSACHRYGWYCRNTGYNPYTAEGKKTVSFEICEQLGWDAPDTIVVAVGDGNIITGIHRGLEDLLALGWIDRMPRLIGVQAEGAPALYNAWRSGAADVTHTPTRTIADSIDVGLPRDGFRALRAVRSTNGRFVVVSDEAILEAMRVLARGSGVFVEPAGAAACAGLQRLAGEGQIAPDERVVVVLTGSGLKDVRAAIRAAGEPQRIGPDGAGMEAVTGEGYDERLRGKAGGESMHPEITNIN